MPPSTASLALADLLPGSHRVFSRRKSGVTLYWYAWRGGPSILTVTARSDAELMRLVAERAPAAISSHKASRTAGDTVTLYGLITRYLSKLPDLKGAPRTKADLRKHLDKVRAELGALELKALESPAARKRLIEWRNRRAATPKTADELFGALRKVIQWAVDNAEVATNPMDEVAGLYEPPDRSYIVWTPEQQAIIFRHSEPDFIDACEFLGHTGARVGDAIKLSQAVIGRDAITYQTGKSNRRKTVVIPITEGLRPVLDRIERRREAEHVKRLAKLSKQSRRRGLAEPVLSTTLLNSSRGKPWTWNGLNSAIQRARAAALAEAKSVHGPDAKSGVEDLHLHDLRGTAITNFMRWGMDDRDIADITSWSIEDVREMRRRYVSGEAIGLAMLRRIKAHRAATKGDQ